MTLACRGLIVDAASGVVLARPYPKFFNHDQPGAPDLRMDAPADITDKSDGSLGVLYPDGDGFAVATVLTTRIHPPAVVLVSSRSRTDYGSRIEDCRARGYIAKAELSGDAVRRLLPLQNRVPPAGP